MSAITWPGTPGRRWLLFAFGLSLIALAYAPGLHGGFVLDDIANLEPMHGYLRGELRWQAVVLTNGSGLLGRPLSMLSLLGNAEWAGLTPYSFKLTNLALHLACTLLAAALTTRSLRALPETRPNATHWGCALGIAWGLMPIHVSTLLYQVRRMAILTALFS